MKVIPHQTTPKFSAWLRGRGDCASLADLKATANEYGIQLEALLIENRPAYFTIKLPNGQAHQVSSLHACKGLISREIERHQATRGVTS